MRPLLALLLLVATTASAGEITAKVTPTDSQAVLLPGWLADLNASLCGQGQLSPDCTTKQLQERAQRADVRIFASLDEWASEVVKQAITAAAQQQAAKLRVLTSAEDLPALQAAVRAESGRQ